MERILHNPHKGKPKPGFTAKNNIIYTVDKPSEIGYGPAAHFGYIGINEYNREHGIKAQVVNFGKLGGYLIPFK